MNSHPIEYLPGYALGALTEEEMCCVSAHLAICLPCQNELDAFCLSIGMAPGASAPPNPPYHIKQQLLARIYTNKVSRHSVVGRYLGNKVLINIVAICGLFLALVFGVMMVDARIQLAATQTALTSLRQNQANTNWRIIADFLSDPTTINQPLKSTQPGAYGNVYMQVGHTRAIVLATGLPQLASGTTYQFWFANVQGQVPLGTFSVDTTGDTYAIFDAPEPVNFYTEMMVTVEPTGGSVLPSEHVVLEAKLTAYHEWQTSEIDAVFKQRAHTNSTYMS